MKYQERYTKAIVLFKEIIEEEGNTESGRLAIVGLEDCYFKLGRTDFGYYAVNEVKSKYIEKNELTGMLLELENRELLKKGEYERVLANYDELIKDYKDYENFEKNALFNKGVINLTILEDRKEAEKIFDKLEKQYPEDQLVEESKKLLGVVTIQSFLKNSIANEENEIELTSVDYQLVGNSPNPFNPTTRISYLIQEVSNVKINIYDITGRLIKSYQTSGQTAGYHSVEWDGRNEQGVKVSSGIYIYRMFANSLENNKNFVQSKKMLMIK